MLFLEEERKPPSFQVLSVHTGSASKAVFTTDFPHGEAGHSDHRRAGPAHLADFPTLGRQRARGQLGAQRPG